MSNLPDYEDAATWLQRCYDPLVARRTYTTMLGGYYDGDQPINFASERFRRAFGWLLNQFADNWMKVVVDSKEERLNVQGFRVSTDAQADAEAWRIWQANDMDAQAQMIHTESLIHGESYATVWVSDDATTPQITAEHPARAFVYPDPRRLHSPLAGLRTWEDPEGHENAELFLKGGTYVYRTERPVKETLASPSVKWTGRPAEFQPNPWGEVMMVAYPNNPRLGRVPIHRRSELWAVKPLQDAINKLVVDMMVASEFQSYRQRWATGLELDRDEDDKPIKPFDAGADTLIVAEDKDVKFGEFETVDLGMYAKAIDLLVMHVASIGSVPPHYLNASADRLSGESIKAAESGMVSKVRKKMTHLGDAHERMMRLTGMVAGIDELANAKGMETIWADPEIRTDSMQADAAQKKKDIGVPWGQTMEDLGYSPAQIERMRKERMSDAIQGLLSAPAAPTAAREASAPLPPVEAA